MCCLGQIIILKPRMTISHTLFFRQWAGTQHAVCQRNTFIRSGWLNFKMSTSLATSKFCQKPALLLHIAKTILLDGNLRTLLSTGAEHRCQDILVAWRTFTSVSAKNPPPPRPAMEHTLHGVSFRKWTLGQMLGAAFIALLTSIETRHPCMAENP